MSGNATVALSLVQALLAGLAVLGGSMAFESGRLASRAELTGEPPGVLQNEINLGLAAGYRAGFRCAILTMLIVITFS